MRETRRVVLGSRGSQLAIAQAEEVKTELKKLYPELQFAIKKIKTTADIKKDSNYKAIGAEGIFTKQIDQALLNGEIDLAVHSLKDVPTHLPKGLAIVAVSKRRNPADALIAKGGVKLEQLPKGARVGTSSIRRKAQLLKARPDLKILEIRGNLDTRIKKLQDGEFDAIVVAQAGLERLNYQGLKGEPLGWEVMLPAPGQGSLAIEARVDDEQMLEMTSRLNDEASSLAVQAERTFLKTLGGGCRVPIASLAQVEEDKLLLEGAVFSADGKNSFRDQICGRKEEAERLGEELAENLIAKGAKEI